MLILAMKMMISSGRGKQNNSSTECNSSHFTATSSSLIEAIGKSSNSSNETVIARIESPPATATGSDANLTNSLKLEQLQTMTIAVDTETITTNDTCREAASETNEPQLLNNCDSSASNNNKRRRLKSFLTFTSHLNPFQHETHSNGHPQTGSPVCLNEDDHQSGGNEEEQASPRSSNKANIKHRSYLASLLGFGHHLQRYFGHRHAGAQFDKHSMGSPLSGTATTRSAPVTPVKWRPLEGGSGETILRANGYSQQSQKTTPSILQEKQAGNLNCSSGDSKAAPVKNPVQPASNSSNPIKPTVRFVDNGAGDHQESSKLEGGLRVGEDGFEDDEMGASDMVAKLFKLPLVMDQGQMEGESPMNSDKFRQYGYSLIDYISNYLETIDKRRVTPLNIEPGYLKSLIQPDAPEKGESFANIMHDFENHIMCGITHWQHPHFHAYFPAGNAYPSILADMLSDALGCVGFSWAASPAYTELEIIMLDWMGKMIGLPDEFLCLSGGRSGSGQDSKGGGVIQGSASECVLVNLLAARHWAMEKLRKRYPNTQDGILLSKLIGYCSKEAHSCVEKAAMIGFIRMRALDTDEKHSLRGETLAKAMQMDQAQGLEPFIVCATLGTTSCVSFDNLEELGEVCQRHDVWLHVDAAYAGSALICPEFKYLMRGIERATSFNMNPNKWMLINFDCSLMWVKDRFKLTRAFVVDPLYLQHSFSDQAIDYRHWGIPLSRRFRALKLWFVIRNYGVEGLRAYIRNHVKLAKLFEQLIREDARFNITNEVVLGLVCFRLVGSNALNQRLLSMINASGKLHMVPASLNGRYVIRFCVCDRDAKEADILYAYRCISDFATELFELIRAGKERIRAISQQNTIDISNISLHKQQSASADCLNNQLAQQAGSEDAQHDSHEQDITQVGSAQGQQVVIDGVATSVGQRNALHNDLNNLQQAPVTPLSARTSPSAHQGSLSAKSPLMKQASVLKHEQPPVDQQQQQSDEDLEQEIVLDSLATIDGYDYDLDDEDLLEPPLFGDELEPGQTTATEATQQQLQPDEANEWRSPVARHWSSRAGRPSRNQTLGGPVSGAGDEDEAKDEVFTLAERRQRMSLRYKREFFVRVVSDPRVYRASISGDINAHSSSCSLAGSHHNQTNVTSTPANTTASTTTSVPSVSQSGEPSARASTDELAAGAAATTTAAPGRCSSSTTARQ